MVKYNIDWTPGWLILEWTQGPPHRVTLTGDARTKVLYEGDNMGKANSVYQMTKAKFLSERKEHVAN